MEYLSDKSSVAKMDKNLEKISPFELKNRLIEMADESVKKMAKRLPQRRWLPKVLSRWSVHAG